MAKITTIIDIGSNSMRMVVMEKSSRFSFNIINETKIQVKLSEGSYEDDANLQELPMKRAFSSLESFISIAKELKSRKIFCVATSALRDAPNASYFISKVKKELKLNIKIINGKDEAHYGALAAVNLIKEKTFLTVDIGGGSTEFAYIENKLIKQCISLDIGTIRLHEMFFKHNDLLGAKKYILNQLKLLKEEFKTIPSVIVGIGGTIRTLSKIIMKKNKYPLDILHSYSYNVNSNKDIFDLIINSNDIKILKSIGVKKDRVDTIKEGTLIFDTILNTFDTQKVITSGAGIREGIYLNDLLKNSNKRFPANYNISVRNLLDKFDISSKQSSYLRKNAVQIFDILAPLHKLDNKFKTLFIIASKLNSLGSKLNFYKSNDNTFNFILSGLHYNFSHEDRITIAYMIKFSKRTLPLKKELELYKELLPSLEDMQFLSFMISLNLSLNKDLSYPNMKLNIKNDEIIEIKLGKHIYLIENELKKLQTPKNYQIKIMS